MTKKALLFAVDSYPAPAANLEAPVKELGNWYSILSTEFEFGNNVVLLKNEEATRARVLAELRRVLRGARDGDQILIGFGGHGGHTRGWENETTPNDRKEHALIVYAGNVPVRDFQHAAITPSDLARILTEEQTPAGVQIVLELDCCEAAQFASGGRPTHDAPPPVQPKLLFIPNAVPGLPETAALRFDAIPALVADRAIATPIIVAASGYNEPAHEVGLPADRRLLFTSHAIDRLYKAFDVEKSSLTYAELIANINPLSDSQSAIIVGNTSLEDELFAGGFPSRLRKPPAPAIPSAAETAAPASFAARQTRGRTSAAVGSLKIRIFGLLALIDLPEAKLPYRNRFVFPFDTEASTPEMRHHAFIEVADHDMFQTPFGVPPIDVVRGGVKYSRWDLTMHRMFIANVATDGEAIHRSAEFIDHVPGLRIVTPDLDPQPRPECTTRDYPPPDLFTGFLDLQAGSVTIGDLELKETEFRGRYTNTLTWGARKTPISVCLTVPVTDDYAVIDISDTSQRRSIIYVRSGRTIVAGNAREEDINGPGSGESPREHFLVYYNLAKPPVPVDAGLPVTKQVPINACTVVTYP